MQLGMQSQGTLQTEETRHSHRPLGNQLKQFKLRKSQENGAGVNEVLEKTQKRDQESRESTQCDQK